MVLLFSWLLGLSALRQGKAIRLSSCNVTRIGSILSEEHVASPTFFTLKQIELKIANDLKNKETVLGQDNWKKACSCY